MALQLMKSQVLHTNRIVDIYRGVYRNYSVFHKSCSSITTPFQHNRNDFPTHNLLLSSNTYKGGCMLQRCHLSTEEKAEYMASVPSPICKIQNVLEGIHDSTGLPWWASIIFTTIFLRTVITFPLSIYVSRITVRLEKLTPEIQAMDKELKGEVARAIKEFSWDEKKAYKQYKRSFKQQMRSLYVRDNCHPGKMSVVAWGQIPLWVGMSFALRNMSGSISLGTPGGPVLCPELAHQGALWFPNLLLPDVTYILPLILVASNLTNIELFSLRQANSTFVYYFNFFMRVFCVIMIPVTASVPSCICFYWVCSSLTGLTQQLFLMSPRLRTALNIPVTSTTPYAQAWQAAKDKYLKKWYK